MKRIFFCLGLSVFLLSLVACSKEEVPATYDCSGTTPTYTTNIKPILDANCATSGCHNATSKEGGRDYSSYTAAKAGASGNAFLGSIQHLKGYEAMPRGGSKLSEANIKLVSCWVQNGFTE